MKRILFLRSNPVAPDPRVEKEAQVLSEAGYGVRVLGWDRTAALPLEEVRPYGVVERIPLPAKFGSGLSNLPHLLRFQFALLSHLIRKRKEYDILHACDFDTLIPALLAKALWRKRVVYDIFDFYADMLLKVPSWLRQVIRRLDLWLMGFADAVILADESRLGQVAGGRMRRVAFIYNTPDLHGMNLPLLPSPPPPVRIGYVGLLSNVRGIREMMDVVAANPDFFLELAGFGGDEEEIKAKAQAIPNVRFHGKVPYERGLEISASSHILFATYDPEVPNHRFSSANKLFEAMALGRPIIVAEGTGMDLLVKKYGLGYVVPYGDKRALEEAIREVGAWSKEKWERFREHATRVYAEKFSWSIQAKRLRTLYGELSRGSWGA